MANNCDTQYKLTGSRKAVNDLWNTLQKMAVNKKDVYLYRLAEHYGIDYEKKGFSVRGYIYFAELDLNEENEYYVLTNETDTAWAGCHDLFYAINEILEDELSISYWEIEPGGNIFSVHDENDFFPENYYVSAGGNLFEDICEIYNTIADVIKEWCSKTGIKQEKRSDEEMMEFINEYEYENDDTFFNIYPFEYE